MATGPYRTDYRIWAFVAGSVFVALGFVDPLAGATWKGDRSLWTHVAILVRGEYSCSTAEMLAPIAFHALLLAIPALAIGWVIQAFVVILWSVGHRESPSSAGLPGHQGFTAEPRRAADRPGG